MKATPRPAVTGDGRIVVTCPACEEKHSLPAARLPQLGGSILCKLCRARVPIAAQGPAFASLRERAAHSPGAAPEAPTSSPQATARGTILVVEDTEFFLQLVADTLAPLYRPLTARSTAEALQMLSREPVDVLILDLTLEKDEDGLAVLRTAASRGIPTLVFTARSEAELWGEAWERLRELGARDLLIKAMNIEDQLLEKVAGLLASRSR